MRFFYHSFLILVGVCLASPAFAQGEVTVEQRQISRTLTVTGRGSERIPATLVDIQLGVETRGSTATAAQQETAQRMQRVMAVLTGVERLQTTGVRLTPIYQFENNRQIFDGYTASNSVKFRTTPERAGQLLDAAVQAGATRIDSVGFSATEGAIAQARQQALRLATEDAQRQADTILSSLNLRRREVIRIQVEGAFSPPETVVLRAAGAPPASPIVPGEQTIDASVTLVITYGN